MSPDSTLGSRSDNGGCVNIKRILAQRKTSLGDEYLIHPAGEPAQHSFWVPYTRLDTKGKRLIQAKPPPFV